MSRSAAGTTLGGRYNAAKDSLTRWYVLPGVPLKPIARWFVPQQPVKGTRQWTSDG